MPGVRRNQKNQVVVLLSGGVDSVTLLHYLKKRFGSTAIHAISFLYGQRHSREIRMARWQAERVGVAEHRLVPMQFFGELTRGSSALTDRGLRIPDWRAIRHAPGRIIPTYVPNRNMVLLAIAAAYAESVGARAVYYGAHRGDRYSYWDCTPQFVTRLNRVLGLKPEGAVVIRAPFARKTKAEIVKIGLALGVDYSHTWSCYRGERVPCGRCPSCVERLLAFRRVGSRDPLIARFRTESLEEI